MKNLRWTFSLLAVGSLCFAACGDDATPAGSGSATDRTDPDVTLPAPDGDVGTIDGFWRLASATIDGAAIVLVDGWQVTLDVDGSQIGGRAACNGYGGTAVIGDGTITVGELSWTEMGCEPAVMQLEQAYLGALPEVTSFVVADDRLTMTGPTSELIFDPVAPVDDTEIVGTTWVLDTMIEGQVASNSPNMSAATLTLNDDGTLTGSTGCRLLEGEWITSGAEVVFTSFSAIDDPTAGVCAPESEALDGFIIGVLEGGFTVEVAGSRLTVMAQAGQGLSYTAR